MVIMSVLVNWLISFTPCEQYFSCIHEKNKFTNDKSCGMC